MLEPIAIIICSTDGPQTPADKLLEDLYDRVIDRQLWLQYYSYRILATHPVQHDILVKIYFATNVMNQLNIIDNTVVDRNKQLRELFRLVTLNTVRFCERRTDIFQGLPPMPDMPGPRERPRNRQRSFDKNRQVDAIWQT